MMDFPPDEQITPQPHLSIERQWPIRIITIHATRGPTTMELQYTATKNWLQSPSNNQGGWGASTNRIISHLGQQCIAVPDNRACTYGAGFGGSGSWAVDWYAINFELAQPDDDTPFTKECLERTAREVAKLCQQYDISPVWLDSVSQSGPVPTGITGHDRTDNGRKLGKSDPGKLFPVDIFMERVREIMSGASGNGGGDYATRAEMDTLKAEIDALKADLESLRAQFLDTQTGISITLKRLAANLQASVQAIDDYLYGRYRQRQR